MHAPKIAIPVRKPDADLSHTPATTASPRPATAPRVRMRERSPFWIASSSAIFLRAASSSPAMAEESVAAAVISVAVVSSLPLVA